MAIDLNGSATGLNYATTYQEEELAASIASSTATVGSGSNSVNTDQITVIRVELASVLFHDRWHINALPASIAIATSETGSASYLSPPLSLSAQGNQVLYLRPSGNGSVTDVAWQNALKAIGFQTNETQGGSRTVNVSAKGASGTWSTWLNSIWSMALYGGGIFLAPNAPVALMLMLLANVDVTAAIGAAANWAEYAMLDAQGREVEAAVAYSQWWRNLVGALPLGLGGLAGWIGANDLRAGSIPSALSRENLEQAVRERLASLELPQSSEKPSVEALELAQALGSEGRFFLVKGNVDDFPYAINNGMRVIKSVAVNKVSDGVASTEADVYFYDASVDITGAANNFHNEAVIRVALPNTSGGLATYYIAAGVSKPLPDITDPVRVPNMLIDASGSSADAKNRYVVLDPRVAIVGGAGDDEYMLMQAMAPEIDSTGKRMAGYIVDGWSGMGNDLVNFRWATGSIGIHTGVSYNGLVAYDGIRKFLDSQQQDLFTRYASTRSNTMVSIDAGFGEGRDTVDLRGGNNTVFLGNGTVYLNQQGDVSAASMAQSLGTGIDLEAERQKGPLKNDAAAWLRLFDNTFDATNINVINVTASSAANAWVQVYANTLASDALAFSQLDSGIDLRFDAAGGASGSQQVPANTYRFARYSMGSTGAELGFADNAIDTIIGSSYSDRIVIDGAAAVLNVLGNGGDDRIEVNRAGVRIETLDGRSNVLLGTNATGSKVDAGVGTQTVITAHAATPTSNDQVEVSINHHLPGVAPENGATRVIADASNVGLRVLAGAGNVEIDLGTGDATVEIGENVHQLVIRDTSATQGTLQLLFRNGDESFDLDTALRALDGTLGRFSRDATDAQVFQSVWTSATGRQVEIRIEAAEGSLDDITLGSVFAATTTYQKLEHLLA